jgi:hypothetical protein
VLPGVRVILVLPSEQITCGLGDAVTTATGFTVTGIKIVVPAQLPK